MNPPKFSNGSSNTASGGAEITRYHFHLDTGSVEAIGFPNLLTDDNSRYINQFDFPTVNEAYRGKEVISYKILLNQKSGFFLKKKSNQIIMYFNWPRYLRQKHWLLRFLQNVFQKKFLT